MSTKKLSPAICVAVALALVWLLAALTVEPVAAQGQRRAALIAQFGDGSYVIRCISFSEESITGLELLVRSGLQVSLWGGAVCRIEQEGCDYPATTCFCQCKGSTCQYWSYWHWKGDAWTYAQIGSGDYPVHGGDVEAWLWGDARTPPVVVSFAEICGPSATSATEGTPTATATTSAAETSAQSVPFAQYALFVLMTGALVAGFWFVRRRQRG